MKKYYGTFLLLIILKISFSQNSIFDKKISLDENNIELQAVLKKIENRTSAYFAYKSGVIDKTRKLSIHVQQMSLENVLKLLLFEEDVKFTAIGNQIILFKPETEKHEDEEILPVRDTIWTNIVNTKYVTDTHKIVIIDTLRVFDTIEVKQVKKVITTYSKSDKLNSLTVQYAFGYNNLSFSNNEDTEIKELSAYQISNQLSVMYGKRSDKTELSFGLGANVLSQNMQYYRIDPYTQIRIDSVVHSRVQRDSSAILIPNIDTLWIYKDSTIYSTEYDTLKYNKQNIYEFDNSNTLFYLTIPVAFSYYKEINRNTKLVFSIDIITNILLSNNYNSVVYKSAMQDALTLLSPEKIFLTGSIGAGFDRKLNKTIHVVMIPYLGFRFTQMLSDPDYSQDFSFKYGLKLGISKKF